MKVTSWRIVQGKHLKSAFDGEGARRFPGSWNQRGTPMIYAAGSLSLSAMEMLVNIEAEPVLNVYMSIPVTRASLKFDIGSVEAFAHDSRRIK